MSAVYIVEERVGRRGPWVVAEFTAAHTDRSAANREAKQVLWALGESWAYTVHAAGISELHSKRKRSRPRVRVRRLGVVEGEQ